MMTTHPPQHTPTLHERSLRRAIGVISIALLVLLTGFAGYYYYDRYVHPPVPASTPHEVAEVENAIRDNPSDPGQRLLLAQLLLSKGQYAEATRQAEAVLATYPENQTALILSGTALLLDKQPGAAAGRLEQVVAARKTGALAASDAVLQEALFYLGQSYLGLGRAADAAASLESAISIRPTDADALYQLGRAYEMQGQPERALATYHRAVRLVPDFEEVYSAMAESYTAQNQAEYVAYAKGMQAMSHKDLATAERQLVAATHSLPSFAPALVGLGLTYERMGKLDLAAQTLLRALVLEPANMAALQALGRIRSMSNQEAKK